MQKMSLLELKELCETSRLKKFIFDTDNQCWDKVDNTIRFKSEYSSIKFSFCPNIITLRSGVNSMRFERVLWVKVDNESILGAIFTIVCGSNSGVEPPSHYTLIAR